MRTYSLEGKLPLGQDYDSRSQKTSQGSTTSVVSVNPRDINVSKKRISTVSSAILPRSGEFIAPDSPSGSIRSDSSRSPRRRVPIIMAANDITTVMGRFHLRLKYDGNQEELLVHLVEGNVCLVIMRWVLMIHNWFVLQLRNWHHLRRMAFEIPTWGCSWIVMKNIERCRLLFIGPRHTHFLTSISRFPWSLGICLGTTLFCR